MFKLIKIQNSGVNVTEPQKFEKSASLKIKAGDALIFENGIKLHGLISKKNITFQGENYLQYKCNDGKYFISA